MPHDDRDAPQSFHPFPRCFVRSSGDEAAYIERMRRSIAWWDRWRWLGVAFHVILIGLVLWGSTCIVELIRRFHGMDPQAAMPETVVLLGVTLCAKLGFILQHSAGGLLNAIFGLRTERLAIAYHDAIEQHCRRRGEEAAAKPNLPADDPDG